MAPTRRRPTDPPATTTPKRRAPKAGGAPRRRRAPAAPRPEDIAARAYAIFEREGGGDEVEHWLRAERELAAA